MSAGKVKPIREKVKFFIHALAKIDFRPWVILFYVIYLWRYIYIFLRYS